MPTSSRSFPTAVILSATSFCLGAIFVNWTYDHKTLWTHNPSDESITLSRQHYAQIATEPAVIRNAFHIVIGLCLAGFVAKLYKPSEANKLFDGGSLVLFMAGIIIYLTNVRTGLGSVLSGDWGDVDELTGINVIAASQVIIAFTLLGVLGLQFGQYWAEIQDEEENARFEQERRELKERRKQQKHNKEEAEAEDSKKEK
ncbi:hypothetical protein BZA70DRAFT_309764 [Myxozyma melibiosi]|uniref:Shr3 amino acid permease chaperone n=1 Tax=Myxozyma melibiosi TaxID=54550 RepID=A0ABR1F8D7_9ASCO